MRMFLGTIDALAAAAEADADPFAALDEAVGWNKLLRVRDEVAQIAIRRTSIRSSAPPIDTPAYESSRLPCSMRWNSRPRAEREDDRRDRGASAVAQVRAARAAVRRADAVQEGMARADRR